ncbi:GINS complex subunit 2 [Trypanosoma rangeli]|uniref:GINS complex subunit 2 n=1 Tax=Trypanosoma rangeli TaxID=5698 RepID=A0A3R7KS72_TRYRA|nr:GINS complex subunit 2 [Trypanosoma rangeli]RNF08628.1 GINS complex subunit 2 [Trypanosoma rangeli]|eukprot:RNF08628.1 GINS complex subunit 2 [Trypanosoma rangeli]
MGDLASATTDGASYGSNDAAAAAAASAAAAAGVGSSSGNNNSGGGSSFTAYHFASFAAMEVTVTMVPRFTMPRVSTAFGGRYGPFAPNYPVELPLWLALHIRQTDTCTIAPPPFTMIPYLRNVVEKEKENEATFEALPFYFFEVVKKLCENSAAAEDVPHVAEVIRLVAEVKAIRRQKLLRSMSVFEADGSPVYIPGIKLTNIVNNELEYLRRSFAKVLQQAAEKKRRREQVIGGAVEGTTPLRPSSGAPPTIASSSISATMDTRMSTHSGLGSSFSAGTVEDTPSAVATLRSAEQLPTPSEDLISTASWAGETTETLTPATESVMPPPLKKRRTLRQT